MSRKPLTKIQESARGEDCALRIPGVCSFDSTTTVLCHAPYPGRHGSRKADFFAVYGCSKCHSHLDLGECDSAADMWMPAIHETQAKLIEKGLMTV